MDEVEFKQRSDAFLSWFKSQPGATFHDNIEICDLRGANRGRGIGKFTELTLQHQPTNRKSCASLLNRACI